MKDFNKGINAGEDTKETKKRDDILDVVKQFISYFEETDRSQDNDNSI